MSARKTTSRAKARMATKMALVIGLTALACCALAIVLVVQNLGAVVDAAERSAVRRAMILGLALTLVVAVVVGLIGWIQGSGIASRITDLNLAVSKLGRGGTEVRVRAAGNDEVGALGRSIQYLASDLAELLKDQEGGGSLVTLDPLVRKLRDRTVPQGFPQVEGYETDGALSPGSRGGLDYFDLVPVTVGAVMYLVSGEGVGALSVVACRMARDELDRALRAGATPRKALAHTNKVMHGNLPPGVCAKASLLHLMDGEAKLYQAGARAPLLICARGEVLELAAEGLAAGLDDGPVFEKSLRPEKVELRSGVRLVLANESALRMSEFLDLLKKHSPMHTAPFMNLVLGSLEQDAGQEGLREDVVLLTAKKS